MASDSVSGVVKPKLRATCWAWPAIAPWRCSTNLGVLVVPEVVKMLQGARAEAWAPAMLDGRRHRPWRRFWRLADGDDGREPIQSVGLDVGQDRQEVDAAERRR